MQRSLNAIVLLFVGALIGSIGFPQPGTARQYSLQRGRGFRSDADDEVKTAYLLGYLDAYRSNMDLKLKPLCTTSGKKWIDDFDYTFPLPNVPATITDSQNGLDEFYKDQDHQIGMFPAQRIVRLRLAGRSQSEIDAAEQESHIGSARR